MFRTVGVYIILSCKNYGYVLNNKTLENGLL